VPNVDVSAELQSRFRISHDATLIPAVVPRDPAKYPALSGWRRGEQYIAVTEFRPPTAVWLFLKQKA